MSSLQIMKMLAALFFLPGGIVASLCAIVIAYNRRAFCRHRVLITAVSVAVGFFAWSSLLDVIHDVIYKAMTSLNLEKMMRLRNSVSWVGIASFIVYLMCGIGMVVWACRARTLIEQRGFPIEPSNSVAQKGSDSL